MFTLSDALDAIKNKPEFTVKSREFGTCIDYNMMLKDSFVGDSPEQTLILKNLRGTCFDTDGKIIRLSFDKFHNLNECNGWRESDIDFGNDHEVLEKLDGSMIAPIYYNGAYRLGTRAGITEVSEKAEAFLFTLSHDEQSNYHRFITLCYNVNYTPIFEYCARDQRIVIDHPVSKLVLTGVRNMLTGSYLSMSTIREQAKYYNIPVVQKLLDTESSLGELASKIKGLIGSEGVVVTFESGFRVKIKGDDYCLKHKALDGLRFEKDVLALILSGGLDDVLSLVSPDLALRLESYRDSVTINLLKAQSDMIAEFEKFMVGNPDKKTFASVVITSPYRTGLFKMFDGYQYNLVDYVATKCGSQAATESIRFLIGKSFLEF